MTAKEILSNLQVIFRDVFDEDDLIITGKTCADDIEDWDSLAQINLVVTIEKEFSLKFTLAELANLRDVSDMVGLIQAKLAQ